MAKRLKGFSMKGSLIALVIFFIINAVLFGFIISMLNSLNHLEGMQGIGAIFIVAFIAIMLIASGALAIPSAFIITPGCIAKYKLNEEKPKLLLTFILIFAAINTLFPVVDILTIVINNKINSK